MTTTEVKTSELSGEALNWVVGMAEGLNMFVAPTVYGVPARAFVNRLRGTTTYGQRYDPGNDWALGGPLIEKYVTALNQSGTESWWPHCEDRLGQGEKPLIAACRAIVAAKLGETVSVPAELL
ncbi:DUF2591 domain-containing protein [Pseudomonas syringae]|nr:DUF2591 domain-containing protein [Pseudomonas syringae]MBD8801940.1 DUF2591 domain-containing protein [Pseudomonas syringae]MBD8811710.1 DUF2591 domain-containing protein [Pseudomonas syringae]